MRSAIEAKASSRGRPSPVRRASSTGARPAASSSLNVAAPGSASLSFNTRASRRRGQLACERGGPDAVYATFGGAQTIQLLQHLVARIAGIAGHLERKRPLQSGVRLRGRQQKLRQAFGAQPREGGERRLGAAGSAFLLHSPRVSGPAVAVTRRSGGGPPRAGAAGADARTGRRPATSRAPAVHPAPEWRGLRP